MLYGLAQECQKLGRYEDAIAWYDRTIAADERQCYAYFHKAKALEACGRVSEVVTTLKTGLQRARACGDHKAANEIESYLDDHE